MGGSRGQVDAEQQGQVERERIYALVNSKAWKVSDQRVQELKTSCVTQLCKRSNPVQ